MVLALILTLLGWASLNLIRIIKIVISPLFFLLYYFQSAAFLLPF